MTVFQHADFEGAALKPVTGIDDLSDIFTDASWAFAKNVEAAQSAYETGKVPIVTLIEAQRNRVMLRDRYFEAVADYFRRRATLERVSGGPLAPTTPPTPARR